MQLIKHMKYEFYYKSLFVVKMNTFANQNISQFFCQTVVL